MKYINIRKDEVYTDANTVYLDSSTGKFIPAKPMLYSPDLKEWIIHNIFRKHFTFGQPYCVVCGYAEATNHNSN